MLECTPRLFVVLGDWLIRTLAFIIYPNINVGHHELQEEVQLPRITQGILCLKSMFLH